MRRRITLRLGRREPSETRVAGLLAVLFGLAGVVISGVVFAPLGLAFSVLALLRRQWLLGAAGFALTVVAVLTSPVLLGLIGLAALGLFMPAPGPAPPPAPPPGPPPGIAL